MRFVRLYVFNGFYSMLLLCALCVRDSDVTDMRRDRGAFSLSLFIPSLTYPNRFGAMRGAMVPPKKPSDVFVFASNFLEAFKFARFNPKSKKS